ncbi:MAG: ABC transporter permease [bacterium]|nr:ABC transporter permease [bacterium]
MISFKDTIRTATQALATHKGRSFLTILGIVIGVSAIMIVMSIGGSATELIVNEVQSFGPENVFINPGKPSEGLFSFGGQSAAMLLKSLTGKDVEDLKKKANVPDAVAVNPSISGSLVVSYGSEIKTTTILGSGAEIFGIYNISVVSGRKFTSDEVDDKASVAVIGKNIVKDLFGPFQDPLGEKIKIKDKKLTVIGILSYDGSSMLGIDDMIIIPYTTMQQYILGIRHFHEIAVKASSAEVVPEMVMDIKRLLRENHDITDPKKDNFIVSTQEDMIKIVSSILNAVTVFLAFVAAIALLVGGVGVMNIMLVSVTERTREIGLRKALGATNKNILTQFLMESVFLTSLGGILGIIAGLIVTSLITLVASYFLKTHFPLFFSFKGLILGIVVSCGTGILFGLFPARKAAQKSPIEALRYE